MDWVWRPDPYHTREAEMRREVWTGKCATRPPPHTREGRDEKVRYGGLGVSRPPHHKRRQRARR
jgi:hypothetical protein